MSKSLIITSLLFSSMILSPSTIAGITAQAAEIAGQTDKPSGSNNETSNNGATINPTNKPSGSNTGATNTDASTKTYHINYIKLTAKKVSVKEQGTFGGETYDKTVQKLAYRNDGIIKQDGLTIDSKRTPVITDFNAPLGYNILDNQSLKPDSNNVINLNVVERKKIHLTFREGINSVEVPTKYQEIVVNDGTDTVDHTKIKLPDGYQLNSNTDPKISNDSATVYVSSKRNVLIDYMNGIKKISISGTFVPLNAKKINESNYSLPYGYKLADNNDFSIANNHVTIQIIPVSEENNNSSANTNKPSTTPGSSHTSNGSSTTNMHTTTVNFVDENGTIVSSSKTTGATGEQKTVSLPDGYKLAANETNDITIGTTDNTVTVKVVKGSAEGEITSHKTVVTSTDVATLYSKEGKQLKGRALSANSNWAVDKQLVLNGTTYYRVATDEWVKANDVYEFASVNKSITTASDSAKTLYTSNGNVIKNRGLAAGSSWHTDKVATINGKQMYRVATNEWVLASDLA